MSEGVFSRGGAGLDGALRRDWITPVVIFVLGVMTALLAIRVWAHVVYPYALDLGEGVALSSMWLASEGKPAYAEIGDMPYVFTIYNPVFIYLGALAMKVFGAGPLGPRLLSAGFTAGAAVVVYGFVRRETSFRGAGAVAALFFLVERHVCSRAGYAVVDYSAIFFSLLGLYYWSDCGRDESRPYGGTEAGRDRGRGVPRPYTVGAGSAGGKRARRDKTRRGTQPVAGFAWGRWLAVLAFALAFFSKQTSLAAAGASFAALFWEGRRRESVGFFALFLAVAAAGLGLCGLFFGKAYFVNAYGYISTAPIVWGNSVSYVSVAVALYVVPVAGAVILGVKALVRRRFLLPFVYFAFGLALSATSGKIGASRSYFFDFAAATAIVAGLLWGRVEARAIAGKLTAAVAGLVVFALVGAGVGQFYRLGVGGDRTKSDLEHDRYMQEVFDETSGVIFCRDHGFEVGGEARNISNDLYQLSLLIQAGRFSEELLVEPVREQRLALVVIPTYKIPWNVFSEDVVAAVKEHYRLERVVYGEEFWVPVTQVSERE